jgi:hypothetical protein
MIKSRPGCLPKRLRPKWPLQGHCASPAQRLVTDSAGVSAAYRRRAATRVDRMVTSIAVLHGTGFEQDGASEHANRSPGRLSLCGMSIGISRAQLSPAARSPSHANNLLDMLMPSHPATGSAMAAQRRTVSFRIHRSVALAAVEKKDCVVMYRKARV